MDRQYGTESKKEEREKHRQKNTDSEASFQDLRRHLSPPAQSRSAKLSNLAHKGGYFFEQKASYANVLVRLVSSSLDSFEFLVKAESPLFRDLQNFKRYILFKCFLLFVFMIPLLSPMVLG